MSTAPSMQNGGAECRADSIASDDAVRVPAGVTPGPTENAPIVFFDGVCALCDHAVKWIAATDKKGVFLYAPLQGETARRRLQPLPLDSRNDAADGSNDAAHGGGWLRSMVLLDSAGESRNSSAVVRILWHLGGVSSVLGGLLWIVPRPLRDWGYRVVARNRYRWFGKRESCRLPTPEERSRFLD